jgi:hypothetical protein
MFCILEWFLLRYRDGAVWHAPKLKLGTWHRSLRRNPKHAHLQNPIESMLKEITGFRTPLASCLVHLERTLRQASYRRRYGALLVHSHVVQFRCFKFILTLYTSCRGHPTGSTFAEHQPMLRLRTHLCLSL